MPGAPRSEQQIARAAAAAERAAILEIVERYMRQLVHGHGATGMQVLQQIADEVERRGAEAESATADVSG
jgi:hypothetical protein